MKKASTKAKKKLGIFRIVAVFAVLAAVIGIASYANVKAASAPEHHKSVVPNGDGTYKISLDVTGRADTERPPAKANILVVYDVSGSMNDDDSYIYAEKDTGRYGRVGSSYQRLYYQSGTNYWGNPTYSQLNNDTYEGTVYTNNTGTVYTGKRYWHVKRSQASEKIVYDFAEALFRNNKTATDDNVEMALVTFSGYKLNHPNSSGAGDKDSATKVIQDWTNSETAFLGKISNTGASTKLDYRGGTNWEAAMQKTIDMLKDADEDPTYVIFVTDGAPTYYVGAPSTNSGNSTEKGDYENVYDDARNVHNFSTTSGTVVTNVEDINTTLYGIYAYGAANTDYLDDVMYYANTGERRTTVNGSTVPTTNYFNASEADDLTAAVEEIFNKIAETLGVTNVTILDGTTSNVQASTGSMSYNLLNVDEESYEYWLSMPVTAVSGSAGQYTMTRKNLVTAEDYVINITYNGTGEIGDVVCTWDNGTKSVIVQGYVRNGILKYKWTGSNDLYRLPTGENGQPIPVPAAHYSASTGAVDWNLSPVGTLLDGVTYTVTFDVWPSQYTYDLVSDIKNELIDYDEDVDINVKQYLKCIEKECTLLTNTAAGLTYTDTTEENPEPETIPFTDTLKPATTEASNMTVVKHWDNQMNGDTHGENEYSTITFKVIKDNDTEHPYDTKVLTKTGNWTDSVFIAPGLIQTKDGKAYIRELGHDYTFSEDPEELNYHWDLEVETVRPMVIDSVLTTLVKVEENAPTIGENNMLVKDGVTYYAINGNVYYAREASEAVMTATNIRRSNLNITKEVVGDAPEDAEFTFKLITNDITNGNLWFSIYDPKNGTVKDTSYVSTSASNIVSLEEDNNGNFNGYYEVKSGSELLVTLKANWNLRFTNLPIGSTYTFEEVSMPDNFIFDRSGGTNVTISTMLLPEGAVDNGNGTYTHNGIKYTRVVDADDKVTYTYLAEVSKTSGSISDIVSGTIYTGNTTYTVKYTNEYELTNITVNKVWDDNKDQDGKRPDEITLKLFREAEETPIKTITIDSSSSVETSASENDKWSYTFSELVKYSSGSEIKYYVVEDTTIDKYTTEYTSDTVSVDIYARDVQDDDTVIIELLANGVVTGEPITLNKGNNFHTTIEDLNYLDDNNKLIVYTTRITNGSSANIKLYTIDKTIEITNTHTPETIKISGTKTWNDTGNTTIRPESITVTLTGTVGTGSSASTVYGPTNVNVSAASDGSWTYEFTDLDRYYNGEEITYTTSELTVNGYETTINEGTLTQNADEENIREDNIINTLITTSLKVTKNWVDESDHDGFRPDSITIRLKANGTEIASRTLTSSYATDTNTWETEFTNLNKFDNSGASITYTITEDTVTSKNNKTYSSSISCSSTASANTCTVTNTLAPDTTASISGTKTWNDTGNTTIRPESITVTITGTVGSGSSASVVYGPKDVTVSAASDGSWSYSLTGLYKYYKGETITYSASEKTVNGYETSYSGNNITNTLITTNVSVTKNWVDESNHDGFRPDSITIRLLANGTEIASRTLNSSNATDINTWVTEFTNLNKFDKSGASITYTVSEDKVTSKNNKDYTSSISCSSTSSTNTCTITNTLAPDTSASVSGTKTWNDTGNTSIRPESITVTVTGKVGTGSSASVVYGPNDVTVSAASDGTWAYSLTGLYKYYNGEEIVYTIAEKTVNGYETTYNGYNITNTLITTSVPVTKIWVDESNHDGFRPSSITVRLLANGTEVASKVLTSSYATDFNTWEYEFTNLNKFDKSGASITYTVTEDTVTNTNGVNYESIPSCDATTNGYTFQNKLLPDTTASVSGTKTWNDTGNTSIRPESITVTVTGTVGSGSSASTVYGPNDVTVSAASDGTWSYSLTGLYKYYNGEAITYSASEKTVNGYETTYSGYNITNTLITTSVSVTKNWVDESNHDGFRPDSITIRLLANGTEIASKTLTSENATDTNTWVTEFTNLNKFDKSGASITYTITEDKVTNKNNVDYSSSISCTSTSSTNTCTVTNTLLPDNTVVVSGTKTWNDTGNTSIRPESITVIVTGTVGSGSSASTVYGPNNVTVSAASDGSWTYTISDLYKYHNGEEIKYSVVEQPVNGYETTYSGYNITNKLITTSVSVTKNWVDESNHDGFRPDNITIRLLANGTEIASKTLTSSNATDTNTWVTEFTNLNKFDKSGASITYTVSEDKVTSKNNVDYTSSISCTSTSSTNTCTVTNTLAPDTTASVSGTKTWNDTGNTSIRPESITVTVTGKVGTGSSASVVYGPNDVTVSAASDGTWSYSLTGLYKYYNGEKIVYTIAEKAVNGYETSYNGYNITNTLITTSVPVTKVWVDESDHDGFRPSSITVRLLANGTEVASKVLTSSYAKDFNTWEYEFTNLNKFDKSGASITYTVTEDTVTNTNGITYESIPSCDLETNGYTFQNKLLPDTTASVSGTKTWNDTGNTSIRPESITVTVTGKVSTGTVYGPKDVTVTSASDGTWSYSVTGLYKYYKGEEIDYTIAEKAVNGYETTYNGYNITNTLVTTSVSVTKNWVDESDHDGFRPDSITIRLLANGTEVASRTLNSSNATDTNTWVTEFTNLNKFDKSGASITYTVSEDKVTNKNGKDYSSSISCSETNNANTCTITNTLAPDTSASVSGTKTWEDTGNTTIRPESITVTITGKVSTGTVYGPKDVTVTSASDGSWTYSVTGLYKYYKGEEIEYTISEKTVNGYETSYKGYNITNKLITTSVSVTKKWSDKSNQDGKRPDDITIRLLANGTEVASKKLSSSYATDYNTWTYEFTNLNKYDKSGASITYTVTEDPVTDYKTTQSGNTFTNTYVPESINISGEKTWKDENDQDGKRPASITIRLLADGEEVVSANVTAANGWKYAFTGLPKCKNHGDEIEYTITEDTVKGYTSSVSGYNVTNFYTPETTSVSGTKTWSDASNQDGIRPTSIIVKLLADGSEVKETTVTPNEKGEWTYTFDKLPKYKNHGTPIKYTVKEDATTAPGYTASVSGYNILNTHTPETISVSGKKVWSDSDNLEGYRPEGITVNLLADGTEIKEVVLTSADANEQGEWLYSFTDLPKFKAEGQEIKYTVTEDAVPNYKTSYVKDDNGKPYIIINEHVPSKFAITVNKEWKETSVDGVKDIYGHTKEIEVKLEGKVGENVYYENTVTLKEDLENEENNWTYTFTDLPEYREATLINYTVVELTDVPEYDSAVESDDKTHTYTLTNTYNPGKVSIDGTKVWDDEDNNDRVRPESIKVNLLADNKKIDSVTVTPSEDGSWNYQFDKLAKYHDKKEITYTVEEETVDGYTTKIENYKITNTHTPETVSFKITKIWNDNKNNDNYRPDSITVRLLADGKEVAKAIVKPDENDDWKYEFTGFNKYKNGELITYTIVEDAVTGYTTEVIEPETEDSNEYTITNTHEDETTSLEITKTWDDVDDVSQLRPLEIVVDIFTDKNDLVDTITITADEGWAKTIDNLPKWLNGELIKYSVVERQVGEYEAKYVETENGYNIINHYELGMGGGEEEPPLTGVDYKPYRGLIYLVLILLSILVINIEIKDL